MCSVRGKTEGRRKGEFKQEDKTERHPGNERRKAKGW